MGISQTTGPVIASAAKKSTRPLHARSAFDHCEVAFLRFARNDGRGGVKRMSGILFSAYARERRMNDIRALRSEADYDAALEAIESFFVNEPEPDTPEADRFDLLALAIADYERQHWEIMP
jgi:hypothetical protein